MIKYRTDNKISKETAMVAKNIDRRVFIKAVGLGAASLSIYGCVEPTNRRKSLTAKPNIIFIMMASNSSN